MLSLLSHNVHLLFIELYKPLLIKFTVLFVDFCCYLQYCEHCRETEITEHYYVRIV